MWDRWGPNFRDNCLITGDSAGSIFACGMALGRTPVQMDELYCNMSNLSVTYGIIGKCSIFMDNCMREMLQDYPNAYLDLQGKFRFGTTIFPFTHVWHSEWKNNEQLVSELRNSYHVPLYCNRIPPISHGYVLDGAYGFAGHDLPHENETLFVGIDPHAEITRGFTFNQMFYPSVGQEYTQISQSGYEALMQWDGSLLRKVGSRIPNYQALVVLWILKCIEIVLDLLEYIFMEIPLSIYFKWKYIGHNHKCVATSEIMEHSPTYSTPSTSSVGYSVVTNQDDSLGKVESTLAVHTNTVTGKDISNNNISMDHIDVIIENNT